MPIDELELFNQSTSQSQDELDLFEGRNSTRPVPAPVPLDKQVPGKLEMLGRTIKELPGAVADVVTNKDYLDQFMGSVANSITMGFKEEPKRTGLPGESVVRTAGQVVGALPSLAVGGKTIDLALRGAIKYLPRAAKGIITASRVFFTEEAVRGAIENSVEFKQAMDRGDLDAMEHAAAGALIDTTFAGLMAKGWTEDAAKLKVLKAQMDAQRFARARNITPEPPKPAATIAEAKAQAQEPPAPPPVVNLEPSPELVTKTDATEGIAKTSKEIKRVKKSRTPSQVVETANKAVARIKREGAKKRKAAAEAPKVEEKTEISAADILKESAPETIKAIEDQLKINTTPKTELDWFGEGKPKPVSPEDQLKINETLEKPTPTESLAKAIAEISDEDIEKFYGKPFEQITDEEIDKFMDQQFQDIDTETGSPEPAEIVGNEESVFRQESAATKNMIENYRRSKSVAGSFEELLTSGGAGPGKDPTTTAWSLITDVNHWLNGGESEIGKTRDFLSTLAIRADELKPWFDLNSPTAAEAEESFNDFKELVSEAAVWAKRVDRGKLQMMRSGGPSTKEIVETLRGWYSNLRSYAQEKLGNKATGAQIKATLKKGSTADEWTNVNLDALLKDDVVYNKAEVLAKIEEGTTEFKDVILGKELDYAGRNELERVRVEIEREAREIGIPENSRLYIDFIRDKLDEAGISIEDWDAWLATGSIRGGTKFSSYVEPGGENYVELFVTAPEIDIQPYSEDLSYEQWVAEGEVGEWPRPLRYKWQDGHADYSDIENPIVRLRMNDRFRSTTRSNEIAKELEEISNKVNKISEANLKGFKQGEMTDISQEHIRLSNKAMELEIERQSALEKILFIEELQGPSKENQDLMPEYLRKRIREIGMKRAIQYAIEGGYDRVAWTTGEMQAERYNLNHVVDRIAYFPNGQLFGYKDGRNVVETTISRENLPDYLGKDLTDRLLNSPTDRTGRLIVEGEDLKLGGQGLRKLYDQDLPNVAKKLGAKVEEASIIFPYPMHIEGEGLYSSKSVPSFSVAPLISKPAIHYMYSGGPDTTKLINAAVKAAKAFKDSMARDRAAKKMRAKEIHKETKEELVRAIVERSGNIEKVLTDPKAFESYGDFGYRVIRNMRLSKGATPRATATYKQFAKEVYGGLSRKESEIVDNLAMAVRMVDIGKYKTAEQFKFPEGKDPESSRLYLATFGELEGLTPEKAYELYHTNEDGSIGGRVGAGFDLIRQTVKDMRDGGLIGQKEYEDLVAHKYRRLGTINSPTTLAEVLDKKYEQTVGDIQRNVYDSGVERLARGSETDIFEPSWKLMAFETMVRAYGRIVNNEANHTLLEMARAFPDNPFVRTKIRPVEDLEKQPNKRGPLNNSIQIKRLEQGISDYEMKEVVLKATGKHISLKQASIDQLKQIDLALGQTSKGYSEKAEKLPKGWVPTYVYDNGHRTTVWMEPSFAKEWIVNSKEISARAARIIKWVTMSPITRTFATGIDPGFALANIPRDMLHLWFAAREFVGGEWRPVYSASAPKFSAEIGEDLVAVSKDALTRSGWWEDYIKYGGGMDFLVLQGRPFQRGLKVDDALDNVINAIGYLNETSEVMTRLAIMRRSLINAAKRNGVTLEEARKDPEMMKDAVYAARDYMDFAQGGWMIKLLDQGVPYLNASVLGVRTFARAFNTKRGNAQKAWWKLGQFALAIAGLYIAAKKLAPETMKELKGDYRTQNSLVIPLGDIFGFEDESGQKRYPFLMVPLDPSVRALKKFFEFTSDELMGEEADVKGTFESIKNMSPVDLSSAPPLEAAILEYFANYDLYKMKQIRRDEEVFKYPKSKAEFGPDTPQALIDLGQITGLSPERLKVAMSEMISSNSVWAQILGEGYNQIFGQMPQDDRDKYLTEMLSRLPITRRFIGLTNPYTRFGESIEKANETVAFDRFLQRNGLDILINGYLQKKSKNEIELFGKKYMPDREGIERYMRSFEDKQVYDRLKDRLVFAEKTADMPHRTLWMKMEAQNSEARAITYLDEVANNPELLNEFEQANSRMKATSRGGLSTEGFRREVMRLQTERATVQ